MKTRSGFLIILMVCIFVLIFYAGIKSMDLNRADVAPMLQDAKPENCAMMLYCFDGKTVKEKWIVDDEKEQKIIDEINNLKIRAVKDSLIKDFSIPCYGLTMGGITGHQKLAYSNGLWVKEDGSVYKAEYDLASLFESTSDPDMKTYDSGIYFPNSAWLGPYDVRFYQKESDMPGEKDGMSLSFVDLKDKTATVRFTNNSEYEYVYGEGYSLQKLIDGEWYTLSTKENIYFNALGYHVEPGASYDMDCDLAPYGELDKGRYRIEKGCFKFMGDSPTQDEDTLLVAEFEIK